MGVNQLIRCDKLDYVVIMFVTDQQTTTWRINATTPKMKLVTILKYFKTGKNAVMV